MLDRLRLSRILQFSMEAKFGSGSGSGPGVRVHQKFISLKLSKNVNTRMCIIFLQLRSKKWSHRFLPPVLTLSFIKIAGLFFTQIHIGWFALGFEFCPKKLRHLKVKILGNLQQSIFLAAVHCQDKMFHLIIFTTYILTLLLGDGFASVANFHVPQPQ